MPDNYNIPQNPEPLDNNDGNYNIGGFNSPFNGTLQNQIPLNIPNVLQSVVGPLIRIPHPSLTQIGLDLLPIYHIAPIPEGKKPDEFVNISKLGTPIMDIITFSVLPEDIPEGKYPADSQNNKGFNLYKFNDILITVNQRKKIVYTDIAGSNIGTVKEFIGLSDYDINITGRLNGIYGKRPLLELQTLKAILDLGKTIGISSRYLNDLNIVDVVVTDYDFPQIVGEYSTQYFTINLLSDNKPDDVFISFF